MKFTTIQILNVTTSHLLSTMDDAHLVCNYMTEKKLCVGELPQALSECGKSIITSYPFFYNISMKIIEMCEEDGFSVEKLEDMINDFEKNHGSSFDLSVLSK